MCHGGRGEDPLKCLHAAQPRGRTDGHLLPRNVDFMTPGAYTGTNIYVSEPLAKADLASSWLNSCSAANHGWFSTPQRQNSWRLCARYCVVRTGRARASASAAVIVMQPRLQSSLPVSGMAPFSASATTARTGHYLKVQSPSLPGEYREGSEERMTKRRCPDPSFCAPLDVRIGIGSAPPPCSCLRWSCLTLHWWPC